MAFSDSDHDTAAGSSRRQNRKHSLALVGVLLLIWLLWSGHYTPMLISFGIASSLFVVLLSRRMDIADEEGAPLLGMRPLLYIPWLIRQIIEANVDVARRILNPGLPIAPRMIEVRASQRSELGRVIYANSITLTPGTVSVDMRGDRIKVHALSAEAAAFDESGEMNRRVSSLESGR